MGYRLFRNCPSYPAPDANRRTRGACWLLLTVVASTACGLTGCSAVGGAKDSWSYNSHWNDIMMGYRNEGMAHKAWHSRKHQFCREKHLHEFFEGFLAGYAAVADGSDGCTPAFPPRNYWGWRFQSPEGQEKVAAWFAGFPHGARAAEEDGIGAWTQIQTSTNVQQRLADQGMLGPGQSVGMYPMPAAQSVAAYSAKKAKQNDGNSAPPETLLSDIAPPLDQASPDQGQYLKK